MQKSGTNKSPVQTVITHCMLNGYLYMGDI